MTRISLGFVVAYAHWVMRWRWPVLLACLLLTVAAASGIRFIERTADYRIYFGETNPQLNAYEALEDIYTKINNIIFVLQPRDKNVFTPETLGIVKKLTEAAWQIPHAARVDSITNFQRAGRAQRANVRASHSVSMQFNQIRVRRDKRHPWRADSPPAIEGG